MKYRHKIKHNIFKTIKIVKLCDDEDWIEGEIVSILYGGKGDLVKSSKFTTVLKITNPINGESYFFKEYHNRSFKDVLMNLFGYTRGKRELRGIRLLLNGGFNTLKPIIYGYVKIFGIVYRSFLVTKAVDGERTYQYFQKLYGLPLNKEELLEKRALIMSAGVEIGRMHKKGLIHGDLRVGNILIKGGGHSALFYFIDNERTRYYKNIPMNKRIKNLVQLNMVSLPQLTRTDRFRFFLKYIEDDLELKHNKKDLIKKIDTVTKKRIKRKSFDK
jgi:tRNA A-37 threonylcarbamoyl transferase component Bud32